jgi:hypothetical protein
MNILIFANSRMFFVFRARSCIEANYLVENIRADQLKY